jgi:hypothetical protein
MKDGLQDLFLSVYSPSRNSAKRWSWLVTDTDSSRAMNRLPSITENIDEEMPAKVCFSKEAKIDSIRKVNTIWRHPQKAVQLIFALMKHADFYPSNLSFNSLRRALRHQGGGRSKRICVKTNKEESFFAVLLDTCAKFNTFCPPRGLDPSAKFASKYEEQFHPLWKVNSFDVLAKGKHTIETLTVNIDVEHLFSLGRPN